MWRKTLDYFATPNTATRRRAYRTVFVLATILSIGMVAMWVRSYVIGDYLCLRPIYLSFARGYCRVVNAPWSFVPPYPVVGWPWVTYPLDRVGEYRMGSGASYVPLWLLTLIFGGAGLWAYRRTRDCGESAAP